MKKKLGILVLCMLMLVGCGDSSEDENTANVQSDINSTVYNDETSKDIETESDNKHQRYEFYMGETVEFQSGLKITLIDAGKYVENIYNTDDVYTYITLDIENTGTEDISFGGGNVEFYGDGYLLEYGVPFQRDDSIDLFTLSPGRRAKGSVYAKCDNYDSLTSIEAEIGDAVFVVKNEADDEPIGDEGVEIYMETVSEMAGTYSDIEGYGIQVIIEQNDYGMADIVFMNEGGTDYTFEDCCPVDNLIDRKSVV